MRVIVTRPERDAARWVGELEATGLQALALPLLAISPVQDRTPIRQAWAELSATPSGYDGVMFVSGHAVEHFYTEKPHSALVFIDHSAIKKGESGELGLRAFATGPGTVQALLREGAQAQYIDSPPAGAGQFDSEALWQVVRPRIMVGQRFLIVRGRDEVSESGAPGIGRDWFAGRLREAGTQVDEVIAYRRGVPAFTEWMRAQARSAAEDGSIWLFSSSQAVENLSIAVPGQDWGAARALATHQRIADVARRVGFPVVCVSRPSVADVLASIESMG